MKKPFEQTERLESMLVKKFGENFFQEIKGLNVRADKLYWFVQLVERGIMAYKDVYWDEAKKEGRTYLKAEQAAALGSWHLDLVSLIDQVDKILKPAEKK